MTERAVDHPTQPADLWLGTVTFGRWGNQDEDECARIIRAAIDRGVTGIDTAASYAEGDAERIVGRALRGRRDQVLLTTKYGYDAASGGAAAVSADTLRRSLDESLSRLGTDHVDVFFLHRVPASADREELADALDALVTAGKARAIGTSMASSADLDRLQAISGERQLAPLAWEQPPHSLFVRLIEADILPTCSRLGIQVATFAPLNGGWLTGKYRRDAPPPAGSRAASWPIRRDRFSFERPEVARKLALLETLDEVAASSGRSIDQLALDFSRGQPGVAAVIVGARTLEQLDQLLERSYQPLDADARAAIDALLPPGTTVDQADILGYHA